MKSVLAILCVNIVANFAFADGKAFSSVDFASFRSLQENEQRAYLSCDGTTQRMLIAIELDRPDSATNSRALWLLPIRAAAADVKMDLMKDMPRLVGHDPRKQASDWFYQLGAITRLTQVWPMLFDSLFLPSLSRPRNAESFQQVDQFGLHSEVIAADSVDALHEYLEGKAATINSDELASFAPYFDGKHCIVATWIANFDEVNAQLKNRRPAIKIDFPSASLWYPMRATSGYCEKHVPVTLFVAGLVQLAEQGAVVRADHRYFQLRTGNDGLARSPWIGERGDRINYTRISVDESANHYTADFTFSPASPPRFRLAARILPILESKWFYVVGAFIGLATLATGGAIAAIIVRQPAKVGALMGLTSVATVFATYFIMRDLKWPAVERLRTARRLGSEFLFYFTLLVTGISAMISYGGTLLFST